MFAQHFLDSIHKAIDSFDLTIIDKMAATLAAVRERGGRLFIVGSGGGAGHASHATNDFRKICGFEAYCPSDNVSELTARINDEGWDVSYSNWLIGSRLRAEDGILVFSVGGGSVNPPVSVNLVKVLQLAKARGASITGVVGRNGGYTAEIADACVVVPSIDEALITPIVEGLQAVVWHLLVSHPVLSMNKGRWEELGGSVAKSA